MIYGVTMSLFPELDGEEEPLEAPKVWQVLALRIYPGGGADMRVEPCLSKGWSSKSPGLLRRLEELRRQYPKGRIEVVT